MPGLTLMLTNRRPASGEVDLQRSNTLLLHTSDYRHHRVLSDNGIDLGWAAYHGYPVQVFRTGECVIYMEGRIYNRSSHVVQADLTSLATDVFAMEANSPKIERFVLTNEGSYVVAIVAADRREVLVFGDFFARLPLCYFADESSLIVAREPKFIESLRRTAFDRVGCAQVLAFGLPLGDRTLLENVKMFPDAGILRARFSGGRLTYSIRTLQSWNLDEEDFSRPVRWHANTFADLFSQACRNWGSHSESGGNIISLSGGHDSRAVAAGIARFDPAAISVSYRDPNGNRENEVTYARELANSLGITWHCIDLPPAAEGDYERLAWLKDGMNYSYMGYILKYLEEIRSRWGLENRTYFSGDGGDDCLKVTSPRFGFSDIDHVIDYVMQTETCMPPERAEAVMKAPAGVLREQLRMLFRSYPERDLSRRIKHFKIFERGRRFYFEGEDRTRFFLWQDSPFYSLPLFRHCMRVPDRLKRYNMFCRSAMMALSPKAAGVPATGSGFPPASLQYLAYYRFKEAAMALPTPVKDLAYRLLKRRSPFAIPATFLNYLKKEFQKNTPLTILLDEAPLFPALKELKDEHSFYCFWTIVMLEKAYRSRMI